MATSAALELPPKLTEFRGVKCNRCGCRTIFVSRTSFLDLPFKLIGLVACRCGGCLNRFHAASWKRRRPDPR